MFKTSCKTSFRSVLLAMVLALTPALANAADIDPAYIEDSGGTLVEYGSGWYLRGDIGTFHASGTGGYGVGGSGDFSGVSLFEDVSLSGGFGWIFNNNLRGDLTVSHFTGMDFSGQSDFYACGLPFLGECRTADTANVTSTAFQANAYYSPFAAGGFTPYFGGGAGLARVNFDRTVVTRCRLDPGEDCPIAVHSGGGGQELWTATTATSASNVSTMLVLSAMAGLDYRLNDRWTVDLGYKFTTHRDVGFGSNATVPTASALNIHELRVGMRYEIW